MQRDIFDEDIEGGYCNLVRCSVVDHARRLGDSLIDSDTCDNPPFVIV